MSVEIPVVDFSKYGLQVTDPSAVDKKDLEKVGKELYDALTTTGFCYISNLGISDRLMNGFRKASLEFFESPVDEKQNYKRRPFPKETIGWIARETETLNPERPADFREAFNYEPSGDWKGMPDTCCSGFRGYCTEFYNTTVPLAKRVLEAVTIGMGLEPDNEIMKSHQKVGQKVGNHCEIRTSYHPPITGDVKPEQVRLGEHFDFGSISLHFQDDVEGLEVCNRDGTYIQVKPIPDTAILLVGECLQIWSANKIIAPKHRVLAPTDDKTKARAKQTLVTYLIPDSDTILRCLDGSDTYEPLPYMEHLNKLMTDIDTSKQ